MFLDLLIVFMLCMGIPAKADNGTAIELIAATSDGVTVQLVIPDFQIDWKTEDGKRFQTISFPGCHFTTAAGEPRLPIQSTLAGIPIDVELSLKVIQADYIQQRVGEILPAAQRVIRGVPKNDTSSQSQFYQSPSIYRQNRFHPQAVAEIGTPGFIRDARVLPLRFNPVQYNPLAGQVRLYRRLVVQVQFRKSPGAPPAVSRMPRPESEAYEQIFRASLINPYSAKQWRAPMATLPFAPPQLSSNSPRYKIIVDDDAMYHLTYSSLREAGIPVATIQPTTLKLSNRGKAIPIFVRGESDGRFDLNDEISFYGERNKGDESYFDPFSDDNVYWLSWGNGQGLRMAKRVVSSDIGGDLGTPRLHRRFQSRAHFEEDRLFIRLALVNENSGAQFQSFRGGVFQRVGNVLSLPPLPTDSWYWQTISAPGVREFTFDLPNVAETSLPIAVRVMFRGQTDNPADPDHHTQIWLNGQILLEDAQWDGQSEHLFDSDEISQFFLKNGKNTISIITPADTEAGVLDQILLNWIELDYWRDFTAEADVLPFSIPDTPNRPHFRVVLGNFSQPDIEIYAVDGTRYTGFSALPDERNPGTYRVRFQSTQQRVASDAIRAPTVQYIALARDQFREPKAIVEDTPSDLRDRSNGADYLIITHESLMPGVTDLADWRRQQGLRVKVIDVQDIYDEFRHGVFNPHAIRDFLAYAYENWGPPAPSYVVLVGDARLDYRSGKNFVPSILIQTPKYGAAASDNQFVTFRGNDAFPDMLIGRLPVSNLIDLGTMVDRIIAYEKTPEIGPWRKQLVMLGGVGKVFSRQNDSLIINKVRPEFEPIRIYADDPNAPIYGGAREVIDSFNRGAAIVNFIGHGGGSIWADNRMMGLEDVPLLENGGRLPFVISMTCFTGYFDNPRGNSLGEELVRAKEGGAIAFLGNTGLGWLFGDFFFDQEIFNSIFKDDARILGEIVTDAKIRFLTKNPGYIDLAEMFTLFGDPAVELALPAAQVKLTVTPSVDANQPLSISGSMTDRGFTGRAEITVFDSSQLHNESGLASGNRTEKPLHRDTVNVVNGRFTTQVVLPQSVQSGIGSVVVYAWNDGQDAVGHTTFSVSQPLINNVRTSPESVPPDQPVHLFADVAGTSRPRSVTLFWSLNQAEWNEIPMVLQTGVRYRTQQPLPPQPTGTFVNYRIETVDQNGHTTEIPIRFYHVATRPDLTVTAEAIEWAMEPPLLLSAMIKNIGGLPAHGVRVRFIDGNSESGKQIGADQVIEQLSSNETGLARVPWQAEHGVHQVTVIVDPPSRSSAQGTIIEQDESNNLATKEFIGNRFLITPDKMNTPIQSVDGNLHISLAPSAFQDNVVLIVDQKTDIPIVDQPDLRYVSTASIYQLDVIGASTPNITATLTFNIDSAPSAKIYWRDEETRKWIAVGPAEMPLAVPLPGHYAPMISSDFAPPELSLTVEHQGFIDGDYVSDTPLISAILTDANGVDVRPEHVILMKNGEVIPATEYAIAVSPTNSNLVFLSYTPNLRAGPHQIRLQAQDANGNAAQTEIQFRVAGEFEIEKAANYPNPFVPGTKSREGTDFAYLLTSDAETVTFKVYTITGRLVVSIEDTLDGFAGYNEFHWEGLDAEGEELSNGVYLYKIVAEKEGETAERTGKLAVVR
ncbi:MAG: C25 family cysteine peptidase [Candidatus Poribacteria bacterium]|nr:C25 family cysteine peptidase [Candidatus Poribacteria bacterium]